MLYLILGIHRTCENEQGSVEETKPTNQTVDSTKYY